MIGYDHGQTVSQIKVGAATDWGISIDEFIQRANGESCISIDYSGDPSQACNRANEAKLDVSVDYLIPKEGALIWFDMPAIPKDAPHAANAHLFLNFLMEANVMATISN